MVYYNKINLFYIVKLYFQALFGLLTVVTARPGGLYDPWAGSAVSIFN